MAGTEDIVDILKEAVDAQNTSFTDAAKRAGYLEKLEDLDRVALPKGHFDAFVELHIEQGPVLEEEGKDWSLFFFVGLGVRIRCTTVAVTMVKLFTRVYVLQDVPLGL